MSKGWDDLSIIPDNVLDPPDEKISKEEKQVRRIGKEAVDDYYADETELIADNVSGIERTIEGRVMSGKRSPYKAPEHYSSAHEARLRDTVMKAAAFRRRVVAGLVMLAFAAVLVLALAEVRA